MDFSAVLLNQFNERYFETKAQAFMLFPGRAVQPATARAGQIVAASQMLSLSATPIS
jgi:hypothetical protein